jgi:hypothetical protein
VKCCYVKEGSGGIGEVTFAVLGSKQDEGFPDQIEAGLWEGEFLALKARVGQPKGHRLDSLGVQSANSVSSAWSPFYGSTEELVIRAAKQTALPVLAG